MSDTLGAEGATPNWWHAPYEFAVHAIAGTAIFVVIAAPAIGLDYLVGLLQDAGIGKSIIQGLQVVEYSLFIVDVFLFVVFLAKTTWRTIPKL